MSEASWVHERPALSGGFNRAVVPQEPAASTLIKRVGVNVQKINLNFMLYSKVVQQTNIMQLIVINKEVKLKMGHAEKHLLLFRYKKNPEL